MEVVAHPGQGVLLFASVGLDGPAQILNLGKTLLQFPDQFVSVCMASSQRSGRIPLRLCTRFAAVQAQAAHHLAAAASSADHSQQEGRGQQERNTPARIDVRIDHRRTPVAAIDVVSARP
jgi:hypothetical protein